MWDVSFIHIMDLPAEERKEPVGDSLAWLWIDIVFDIVVCAKCGAVQNEKSCESLASYKGL